MVTIIIQTGTDVVERKRGSPRKSKKSKKSKRKKLLYKIVKPLFPKWAWKFLKRHKFLVEFVFWAAKYAWAFIVWGS